MKKYLLLFLMSILFLSYQKTTKTGAKQAEVHYGKAIEYFEKQEYEKAIEQWKIGAEAFKVDTLRKTDYYNNIA